MKFKVFHIILFTLIFGLSNSLLAQEETKEKRPFELDFNFQAYPAGIIPGLQLEIGVGTYYKSSLGLKVGYNRARRRNWGEHEDERGGGFGGGIFYKYYLLNPNKQLYIGARTELWKMIIDWRNSGDDENLWTDDDIVGFTDILVFQPTLEMGYKFVIPFKENSHNALIINPNIAAGWELNVISKGDDVGQGSIALIGVDLGLRF